MALNSLLTVNIAMPCDIFAAQFLARFAILCAVCICTRRG